MLKKEKKSQVTVFIILGILLIGGVVLYFVFSGNFSIKVPSELEPVYSSYLNCIDEEVLNGAGILGQQGGYIYSENLEFYPGSVYMPFSSQLDFLGVGVPYWSYVSGNGVSREQKPGKEDMQKELESFIKNRIVLCDLSEFSEQGFNIERGAVKSVRVEIEDNLVVVDVDQDVSINLEEDSWTGSSHRREVKSSLGKMYELAGEIYDYNKEKMFLENYGVDILRSYAPVDGVEITCSPKSWTIAGVRDDLIKALEANIPFTKIKGNYYNLGKPENKYYVQDIGEDTDASINFMYSRNWPMKMEVWPSDGNLMRADPVGLQEGLGMLGFCYVPYHFVYDFSYPVLIQIFYGREMFQFPVVVLVDKNSPRKAQSNEGLPNAVPELCEHKNQEIVIKTYNTNLEPVEASIDFKCFDTSCEIGDSVIRGGEAVLRGRFPQCVNGFIVASAEGYETEKILVNSVSEDSVLVVLDKKYSLALELNPSELDYAVINFIKDNKSTTLVYPEQKQIEISEGQYVIKVYAYTNTTITLEGSSSQKCVDVPKSGMLGIFGSTEEKCFELDIPQQIVSYAVSGGGTENYYITESELRESEKIIITPENYGVPSGAEDLQLNYNLVESNGLGVRFE